MKTGFNPVPGYTSGKSRQRTAFAIPSAPTLDLRAYDGKIVHVSGTATVLQILPPPSGECVVVFDGACVLTYNSTSLILPGAANITAAANDTMVVDEDGDGLSRVTNYTRASGASVVASIAGWNLLGSPITASNSATVDVETTFDSTYDDYAIVYDNVTPANANVSFYGRMKVGGAYDTGSNYSSSVVGANSSTSTYQGSGGNAEAFIRLGSGGLISTTAGTSVGGIVWLRNPTSTSLQKTCRFETDLVASTNDTYYFGGTGKNSATTALTGFRFYFSAGNVATGTFRLYGLRKT